MERRPQPQPINRPTPASYNDIAPPAPRRSDDLAVHEQTLTAVPTADAATEPGRPLDATDKIDHVDPADHADKTDRADKTQTGKPAKPTKPSKPKVVKPPRQRHGGSGLAIFAAVVIVLGLGAMFTYAYLRSNNIALF